MHKNILFTAFQSQTNSEMTILNMLILIGFFLSFFFKTNRIFKVIGDILWDFLREGRSRLFLRHSRESSLPAPSS